jgi:hypothetical protein
MRGRFRAQVAPQAVDPVNSPESFQPVRVNAQELLEEAIETTRIHSVAGMLEDNRDLVGTRAFRSTDPSSRSCGRLPPPRTPPRSANG